MLDYFKLLLLLFCIFILILEVFGFNLSLEGIPVVVVLEETTVFSLFSLKFPHVAVPPLAL